MGYLVVMDRRYADPISHYDFCDAQNQAIDGRSSHLDKKYGGWFVGSHNPNCSMGLRLRGPIGRPIGIMCLPCGRLELKMAMLVYGLGAGAYGFEKSAKVTQSFCSAFRWMQVSGVVDYAVSKAPEASAQCHLL